MILAACLSLDGYSGTPPPDGGSSTSSSGAVDGSTATNEGGGVTLPDGATGSPDAGNLCAKPNLYCDTFDESALPSDNEEENVVTAGGLTEISSSNLHVSAAPLTGDGQSKAYFGHHITSGYGLHNAFDVDVFMPTPAWGSLGGNFSILSQSLDGGGHEAEELYIGSDQTSITTTYQNTKLLFDTCTQQFPYDRWVHVRLEVDFTPGSGSFVLSFDGTMVASRNGISFSQLQSDAYLMPRMGVIAPNPPTPTAELRYDNAILTAQ